MTDSEFLVRQFEGAYHGEAWYGSALRPMLEEFTPENAARKPLQERHSVWEIVLHLIGNIDFVIGRLDGRTVEMTPETDWPPVTTVNAEAWAAALTSLDSRHEALLARTRTLSTKTLDRRVIGRDYLVRTMLLGILQHNVYHAGQVAILRQR
jgi:uncharacterized damage-inducible protein DinB